MTVIPGTTRSKRRYAERIRDLFINVDRIIFAKVDLAVKSEDAYRVIQLAPRQYAVAIEDPSVEQA